MEEERKNEQKIKKILTTKLMYHRQIFRFVVVCLLLKSSHSLSHTQCIRYVCVCESVFMLCIRCHPFRFYYVCLANTMFPIQITHVWFIVHGFSFFSLSFHSFPFYSMHIYNFSFNALLCVCSLARLIFFPLSFSLLWILLVPMCAP